MKYIVFYNITSKSDLKSCAIAYREFDMKCGYNITSWTTIQPKLSQGLLSSRFVARQVSCISTRKIKIVPYHEVQHLRVYK